MKVSKEALNKVRKNEQLRDYIIHKLNVEKEDLEKRDGNKNQIKK